MMLPDGRRAQWPALPPLLKQKAFDRGGVVALEVAGKELTYGEWNRLSDLVAANLSRIGLAKGDRIAVLLNNSIEQILVWYGAAKRGVVSVMINAALVGDDLRNTLSNAAPLAIVADGQTHKNILLSDPSFGRLPTFVVGENFDELLQPVDLQPDVELRPSDPATILYSGGTTGLPKGILLTHFSYIAGGYRYRDFWAPRPGDIHLSVMQLYHAGAQYGAAIAPLFEDVKGVIERRFSASTYWRRVCETGATIIDPLGTMLPFLSSQPPGPYDRAHKVRACWFATAHLPAAQRECFEERFGVRLFPGTYAQTECGGNYMVSGRFNDANHPIGAVGKSWGWVDIRIADELGDPVPAGTVGEILMRPLVADMFMLGYHRDPHRTAEVTRNFWLHTGDLGRLDESGYLYFEGRKAHWMRRRGENISAYEVENVLARHPAVREVVVIGVPAEIGGEEEVKAFVILEEGFDVSPATIHQWCTTRMTPFKIPRFIELVQDLPRSAAKREVERAKLRQLSNALAWDAER
jgi:crotonobetaine/carnitine-CoA ligase